MKSIETLTYILIVIGTLVNLVFGIIYNLDLIFLMKRSIVVTVLFLLFGYISSKVLSNTKNKNNSDFKIEKSKSSFQYDIPPITDEELKEISVDEDFQEINPAALYIRSKINNDE